MNYQVTMPSLGADMDHGKIMEWKINPGDHVSKGQTIAVVETTKSNVEIESFRDGHVTELVGKIGEEIPVGAVIALFEVQDEKGGMGFEEFKKEETSLKKSSVREVIAHRMSLSKKDIPHYYLKHQINLGPFMNWLDKTNMNLPPDERIMIQVGLLRAVVISLNQFPELNGHFVNDKFSQIKSIHTGVVMAFKEEGVIVPAILESQLMSLKELNTAFLDIIARARSGRLKNRELTEGTITITNLGDQGIDEVFGIIFPPQVAIIGFGKIHKAPVITGDVITPEFVVNVTLSADHRVTDGMTGARFLAFLEEKLMFPQSLGVARDLK